MDEGRPDTRHLVRRDAGADPAAADRYAALDAPVRNSARHGDDVIWIVVARRKGKRAEVLYLVACRLYERCKLSFQSESAVVSRKAYAHTCYPFI